MAVKTYHGSCACGKVRFEADIDLAAGTFKCNCTVCTKGRFWGARVKREAIRVTAGEENIVKWGETRKHHICRFCGIKLFGVGIETCGVNLGALDDLDPREWAAAPVRYADGRNDNWKTEPEFKGHL